MSFNELITIEACPQYIQYEYISLAVFATLFGILILGVGYIFWRLLKDEL